MKKIENDNNKNILMVAVICLLMGAGVTYYITENKNPLTQTIINKSEKEVTIDDKGIADAVEKLYNAVVVVGNYQNKVLTSSGTGFVYKTDDKYAYLITNNHVVSGSKDIKITFTNDKQYDVELVGTDEYSDIAVLKTEKANILSTAEMGSYKNARLGDTAFTIGAPLDSNYSWTVTRGIISGKDRLVEVNSTGQAWVMKVMQTDAAINSGNSGGPIANANGEVIGVTNMKLVSSGVEGMGFAIPIEDALSTAAELIKSGKIDRPLLGVGFLDVNQTTAMHQYGFSIDDSITEGAVVGYIQKGSVAEEAGLKQGDVITKFGDEKVKNSTYLKYYLYTHKIGDTVKVTYLRGIKEITVNIKLTAKSK